jgi:hypothetical protein
MEKLVIRAHRSMKVIEVNFCKRHIVDLKAVYSFIHSFIQSINSIHLLWSLMGSCQWLDLREVCLLHGGNTEERVLCVWSIQNIFPEKNIELTLKELEVGQCKSGRRTFKGRKQGKLLKCDGKNAIL